jgi:murein DD-endopeptidase MepM/ murein hydrolase activator NlpD
VTVSHGKAPAIKAPQIEARYAPAPRTKASKSKAFTSKAFTSNAFTSNAFTSKAPKATQLRAAGPHGPRSPRPRELRLACLSRLFASRPETTAPTRRARYGSRMRRREGGLVHAALRTLIAATVFAWALWTGAAPDLAGLSRPRGAAAVISAPTLAASAIPGFWAIDVDGDGVADYANPTHGPIRGRDAYGTGAFGSDRDAGARKHEGADYVVSAGAVVDAPISGVVTRLGFAYPGDQSLRYIEVNNSASAMTARILYVKPSVAEGQRVIAGDPIGVAESLATRYPRGITNHVHVQISNGDHVFLNPAALLPSGAPTGLYAAAGEQPRLLALHNRL